MGKAAELERGGEPEEPGEPAPGSPVRQLSLWPPPRSTKHSGKRRRGRIIVGVSAALLLAAGGTAAWVLAAPPEETVIEGARSPESFVGSWAGEMIQRDTEGSFVADWRAEIVIHPGAERGRSSWPTFGCSGVLELSAHDGDRMVYEYTESADPDDRCVDSAELTLTPGADETVLQAEWVAISREGNRMTSTGTVH